MILSSFAPALCLLPLFQGTFPLFAFEILIRLNFSFSSISRLPWVKGREFGNIESSCKLVFDLEPSLLSIEWRSFIVTVDLITDLFCWWWLVPLRNTSFWVRMGFFHINSNLLPFWISCLQKILPGNWDLGEPKPPQCDDCEATISARNKLYRTLTH